MPAESRCSPREIQNYLGRISGPLLDRIDIHVKVPPVQFRETNSLRFCISASSLLQLHRQFQGCLVPVHPLLRRQAEVLSDQREVDPIGLRPLTSGPPVIGPPKRLQQAL